MIVVGVGTFVPNLQSAPNKIAQRYKIIVFDNKKSGNNDKNTLLYNL